MLDIIEYALFIFIYVFVFLIGLCFGSFANVVIYRIPKKISIINPPSHCPSCNKRLATIDLIPLFSWLFLLAKCRTCKNKISPRYPFVELLCGLLFVATIHFSGITEAGAAYLATLPLLVLMFVLLAITFIDIDIQEIPDGLVITGAIAGTIIETTPFTVSDATPEKASTIEESILFTTLLTR